MSTPAVLDTAEEWVADALDQIRVWASAGYVKFTADDLRGVLRPAPHPSLVGAAFQVARRRGWITQASTTCSNTPSRKHSLIREWVGTPDVPAAPTH